MHQTCIGKVSFGEKSSVFSPAANDFKRGVFDSAKSLIND
jgi:hypothetical protein